MAVQEDAKMENAQEQTQLSGVVQSTSEQINALIQLFYDDF
jgi:hypothetical protein